MQAVRIIIGVAACMLLLTLILVFGVAAASAIDTGRWSDSAWSVLVMFLLFAAFLKVWHND